MEGKIEGKRVVLGGGDALAIVDGLAIVDCRSNASKDVVVERDIAGRVRDPHSVEDRTDSGVGRGGEVNFVRVHEGEGDGFEVKGGSSIVEGEEGVGCYSKKGKD